MLLSFCFIIKQSLSMKIKAIFLFIFLFFYLPLASISVEVCPHKYCSGSDVPVHFPFSLDDDSTSSRCSYPGFDLLCQNQSQTTLQLPKTTGSFTVQDIDYESQYISINDPNNCMPHRYLNGEFSTNLSGSPFFYDDLTNFTFVNCSNPTTTTTSSYGSFKVSCLSGDNYTVLAWMSEMYSYNFNQSTTDINMSSCDVIKSVEIPVSWPFFTGLSSGVRLYWRDPQCGTCEQVGGSCGFTSDKGFDVGCSIPTSSSSSSGGLSRAAKYGISVGIGIPGLLCLIGLTYVLCGKFRNVNRGHNLRMELYSINPQAMVVMGAGGLAGSAIEKFPKTLLGESRRLPNYPSGDNICPICLSEYQAKETLRTIPECNHYFHSNCIDEWLRMNGTCPLCRNSPDGSSTTTSSSSRVAPSSFSSSPSSSRLL